MSSVGESEPPSPTSGPPANFDIVAPGIYRSSFPRIGNFEHLRSLGLKTILTLVPEEYPPENKDFVKENCIRHFQIPIPANKDPFVTIPPKDIAAALEILLDTRHHPVLIHCNKGKHRTGCVVGCYRKIHDWTNPSIIAEYRRYAAHKARVLDERFIELFDQHAAMAGVGKETDVVVSAQQTMPTPPSSVKGDPKDDETPVTRMHRGVSKSSDASSTV
ncbi:hypothetical protein MMC24_007270 [Lignoscripta atroalba]|nr:hypothetical protein [Lignoscripta atroalba]